MTTRSGTIGSRHGQDRAIDALERSLELAPRHRPTYDVLVEAYEEWDEPEKLEATKRRILEVFPDDLERSTPGLGILREE